ncbi:MAG TPA: hypothetical protein VGA50_12495 [Kiloniellales bacterium]
MATLPDAASDLFAAKGRAMPACSGQPIKRPAPQGSAAPARGKAQEPDHGEDTPQGNGPASILSIDVRAALVAAPTPAREGAPEREPAPQVPGGITAPPRPQSHGAAGPLIAAVVAISIAAGLFYVFGPHRRGVAPATAGADAPAAADAARSKTAMSGAAAPPPEPSAPPQTASVAPQPAEAPAGQANEEIEEKAAGHGRLPSFDLVRVERDGATVIAGRAAPYAELILLHNGEPIGKVTADWAGEWAFVADQPLPADQHRITILVNEPDAEITLPEGVEPPAQVSGLVNSGPR